jgi:hypothetical protein
LAKRNYWNPKLSQRLNTDGLHPLAPYKSVKRQRQPYPGYLIHMHYRIETAFDQLVQRFHDKRVWARDLWHLTSRWMKILELDFGGLLLFSCGHLLIELCPARRYISLHIRLLGSKLLNIEKSMSPFSETIAVKSHVFLRLSFFKNQ